MSTLGLIESLDKLGIASCAVCHDSGTPAEREQLREVVHGEASFMPLYWWNRKMRATWWKRPLLELRQILKTGWGWRSAARVANLAKRFGADLIHTNTILVPEGGLAARSLGLPHVWHLRELIGSGQPFQIAKSKTRLNRFFKDHASVIVANSQTSARNAAGLIPEPLLRVVPNGIRLNAFAAVHKTPSDGRSIVVGMVGSLSSRTKKHKLFVEAASRLKDIANVRFRIYGHDPAAGADRASDAYATEIHNYVKQAGLADQFDFPGHLDPVRIMNEIDILVHPADNESFGRVVVEAMAAELPVVGVCGGGVAEIVVSGETGLLAPPDRADELSAAIRRLLGDASLRSRLGKAGRRRAEECYSLESCVAGILQVYEEAMPRPLRN